jgi:hypothetical protein
VLTCHQCNDLLALLRTRGLGRWLRCPRRVHAHGYATTRAFDHLVTPPSLVSSHVNRSIEAIVTAGQVPWLDLDTQGHWHVWRADHGGVPPEVMHEARRI